MVSTDLIEDLLPGLFYFILSHRLDCFYIFFGDLGITKADLVQWLLLIFHKWLTNLLLEIAIIIDFKSGWERCFWLTSLLKIGSFLRKQRHFFRFLLGFRFPAYANNTNVLPDRRKNRVCFHDLLRLLNLWSHPLDLC